MSLTALHRSQKTELGRWSVLRNIHEHKMNTKIHARAACITELQASTTTHHSDEGVMVKINASTLEALQRRNWLWLREQELAQQEMAAMQACVNVSWRAYNHRCRVLARLEAAQRSHDELQTLVVEGLREQSKAACQFAAKQSQRGRPLAVCRASNAPNGVSVNEPGLSHAAMRAKEVAAPS